ncbi:MAG: thiopurine S-methyltransferase [Pseudomonadota bacterium]
MEAAFWQERWERGEIGFHQDAETPLLVSHWDAIAFDGMNRVLVPLCGKSQDLLWLANQGLSVTGIELSQSAVEGFFSENGLTASSAASGSLVEYRCDSLPITLYQGDFFDLPDAVINDCDLVFDRAALIALPPPMRVDYVARFADALGQHACIALITLEHTNTKNPPFSVSEDAVRALYQDRFDIQTLGTQTEMFRDAEATNVLYRLSTTSMEPTC